MARKKTQKRSKLAPALLITGVAGAVVAVIRKRGGKAAEQVNELAERAKRAAPEPAKQAAAQAAGRASELADRAKEAAPDQVKQAVDKATGATTPAAGEADAPRYAAPAEAGSQPPAEPSGAPSDDPGATVSRSVPSEALHTKAHDLPADTVMPDVSDDDPAVREAEDAAAADAAKIGGDPNPSTP
jgi:hypothetical protein